LVLAGKNKQTQKQDVRAEVTKLWGAPRGELLVLGGTRLVCMKGIFILNEMWKQNKIHILVGTLLG
jgi:hypothetical protein